MLLDWNEIGVEVLEGLELMPDLLTERLLVHGVFSAQI